MRKSGSPYVLFLLAIFVVALSLSMSGLTGATNDKQAVEERPDLITIDTPMVTGEEEMPPVHFRHESHTRAVQQDCTVCHLKKKGAFVFKFKRLADVDAETAMNLYHDNCTACHLAEKKKGHETGPETGECRICHQAQSPRSVRQRPVVFDRTLHYRHEKSGHIKYKGATADTNCGACHHQYNEETGTLYYEKSREGACVYCHPAEPVPETPAPGIDLLKKDAKMAAAENADQPRSIRHAAHDACVACHQKMIENDIVAGPVECAGCHGPDAFKDIEPIDHIPRLNRNQPDTLFIKGWSALNKTNQATADIEKQFMHAVPFDHKFHEQATGSCKTCHHASLEKCGDCHTPASDEKGGYIRLDQAMHATYSHRSCMGCHDAQKETASCAGCHFAMPEMAFADKSCETCHYPVISREQAAGMDKKTAASVAGEVLAKLKDRFSPVPDDKIPETVKIGVIADTYEPSRFPHRKVVRAIMEKIKTSDMAAVFHGDGQTLCTGCHHNSPASLTPPKCASCHGQSSFARNGRPGLKGAYHGQCITCHQQMKVETVAATDCAKCHKEKNQ
ncbi:MAG: cytochrome c3 family protein [Thermodesulfobacteriota bacterium]|nr:cytochrome c3 family protein [Thermodesulfobacteriota bacterium]